MDPVLPKKSRGMGQSDAERCQLPVPVPTCSPQEPGGHQLSGASIRVGLKVDQGCPRASRAPLAPSAAPAPNHGQTAPNP